MACQLFLPIYLPTAVVHILLLDAQQGLPLATAVDIAALCVAVCSTMIMQRICLIDTNINRIINAIVKDPVLPKGHMCPCRGMRHRPRT